MTNTRDGYSDRFVCETCGGYLEVVCYWRRQDESTLVYDGPYIACGCDDGESPRNGDFRAKWVPESDADLGENNE